MGSDSRGGGIHASCAARADLGEIGPGAISQGNRGDMFKVALQPNA